MTQLSDTQTIILSRAAQNEDRIALPLPDSLRGGAAAKVVSTMIAKGLIEEVDADMRKGEPLWRETGDGHGVTLVGTNAGLAAIGIEAEDAAVEPIDKAAPKTRTPRAGTKQANLIPCCARRMARPSRKLLWQPSGNHIRFEVQCLER